MSQTPARNLRTKARVITALGLVVFVGLAIFGIVRNAHQVAVEIDNLAKANTDSPQWTLSQIEVEFNKMRLALEAAQEEDPQSLGEFHQRFDIFYSRIQTITEGSGFRSTLRAKGGDTPLAAIWNFLDFTAAKIDAHEPLDSTLKTEIDRRALAISGDLRALALMGMTIFSEQIKDQREQVFDALVKLAILTLLLFAILTFAAVALWLLWRFGQQKARSLRDAMSRITAVVNASLDAVIVVDSRDRIVDFNAMAQTIFGCDKGHAIGANMADFVVLPEAGENSLGLIERQATRANGEAFPAELSIRAAEIQSGRLRVIYLRDISRRVAAQKELITARDKALAGEREKSRFVSVMSHELRTPLNGLLGSLELIRETELDPRQTGHVEAMETAGRSLLHHVNDVLDVGRLDAGKLDLAKIAFDPAALAQEVVKALEPAARTRGNTLTIDAEPTLPKAITGDPTRLRQILMNLVGNAVKFTRDGVVRVELEYVAAAQSLEMRVVDDGIGIDVGDQKRIFDDFISILPSGAQDISGTGLGLGIVRRLLQAMGGEIGVESEVNQGSTFWVTLPAPVAALRPQTPKEVAGEAADITPRNILIVEDNALNREVLRQMLLQGQHQVTMAVDGQDGVEIAAKERFDLILMDLNMPRMDGMQATYHIRAGDGPNRETKIVAVTANVSPEAAAELQAAGCDDVVCKPINRAALNKLLSAADKPPPQPAQSYEDFIDAAIRADLLEMYGAEKFARLQQSFIDDSCARISAMQAAFEADDLKEYATLAHQVAGMAGMMGFGSLRKFLKQHEDDAKAGRREVLEHKITDLQELWARVEELIHADIAVLAPPSRGDIAAQG